MTSLTARSGTLVEDLTGETRPVGKVQPGQLSAGRHVTHALVDLKAPRTHVVVAARVDVVHRRGFAGDRVQPEVAALLVPVPPLLEATLVRLDPRREVLVALGHVLVEHVGRLGDVVVHADQDHVLGSSHGCSFRRPPGVLHGVTSHRSSRPGQPLTDDAGQPELVSLLSVQTKLG